MRLRGLLDRFRSAPVRTDGPLALVYRGPATVPGCPESVAALLASSRHGFDVRFVGPREELKLSPAVLAGATLYAQPGGGTLEDAWPVVRRARGPLRDLVAGGGRYLGFCLGGYLAGATPGFGLLPGDTDRWIDTRGATVTHDGDALVRLDWCGRDRTLYFQDGPHFLLDAGTGGTVLARYPNDEVAAAVTPFGAGRVGVVGPHPEAGPDWFDDAGLPRADARDLGLQLIDEVMA
ncbi:BPL-N domain-containing protein [Pseudonocardia parietis]|uniref:Glutamine amidotransferase-like uncharacterized protein n=1 Tax=Pseudonocardia parietis TaxID=570936 RepID=A0ABS4VXD9_9PSEU|nr:BPL-N domain-containing protein [Pseudonocardia parietis]MBP2368139.1 glutamine amidotransferase-like uncharacterized protein [Pseudonocardia parietis]